MIKTRKSRRHYRDLIVYTLSAAGSRGHVRLGNQRVPAAVGRSGQTPFKREGDGASPVGRWRIESVFYRADRGPRPQSAFPVRAVRRDDGWCDAPLDRNYNRLVRRPYDASHEVLWREDGLYDIVVVLSHNRRPRVRSCGSAIFLHVARDGLSPTEGCLAVRSGDLRRLLASLRPGSAVVFAGGPAGQPQR
ncbi:MAG: L,D-transpeptidase family protein, partial [Pseudomonadota bacterium]